MKKTFPLSRVYQLLEPGPVVLVTTAAQGAVNIMTMAWYTMLDFEPPLVGCVVSERNYSFALLQQSKECVINIPTVRLASTVVDIGKTTGEKIDKFTRYNLSQEAASLVNVPMIAECYANLECRVVDTSMVKKYNLFVVEVIKAWITPYKRRPRTIHHCGNGLFVIDGDSIKLPFVSRR